MVMFVTAAAVGIVIGLCSGLLGVGGGMIMVPVFRLAFGMSPVGSTATSLFTIIPTSVSGAVQHIRGKTCVLKLGLLLGVGGACTSPLGAWLADRSPGWLVMVITACVIAYSGVTTLRKAMKAPKGPRMKNANAGSPQPEAPQIALDSRVVAGALGIGLVTGLASGYVGLGGGFIMVPLMMALLDMPMRLTSGTSLIAIMILAVPGTIMQCSLGNVDYLVGIATACGSIPGAMLGARLVPVLPERTLRFAFAAFLGLAAILLVANEAGVLG